MRLSAKTRYALAAMLVMAADENAQTPCTAARLSGTLQLSMGYLEQVLLCLRRGRLIEANRGSQGGYRLQKPPEEISVLDILLVMEPSAFAPTAETTPESAPELDRAAAELVYAPLDQAVQTALAGVSVAALRDRAGQRAMTGYMYYL